MQRHKQENKFIFYVSLFSNVTSNKRFKIIPRRQELPKSFHRDGSIYITKTGVIKNGSLYGNSIAYIESNPDFHVNIDTLKDWEKAEHLLTKIHL